ncbi:putative sugar O-methyltransferase [Fundidesulfovibrio butyratiphilus]
MKEDQAHANPVYVPSSVWQKQLEDAYQCLFEGLEKNDMDTFHHFLENFGAWDKDHGIESTTLIRKTETSFLRRAYVKYIFSKSLQAWRWINGDKKDIRRLSYPQAGNQNGTIIEGTFVGIGSFFNDIYGDMLSGLVCDIAKPVVADLGAGYGKLAYFTLRDKKEFTFIDFDIPETLCLASYYLLNVWPEKKALLYGEEPFAAESLSQYDLIFLPSWEIEKLPEDSVDLFMNKNSLGEMDASAVVNYVHHICRSAKYFFHMNHDIYPVKMRSGRGLLGKEYPVPRDTFKLLIRYPDIGHLLYKGYLNLRDDIFFYLYEKMPRKTN